MKAKKGITRRDFLRDTAAAMLIGVPGASVGCRKDKTAAANSSTKRSKVVLIREQEVLDENRNVDAGVIARMLDDGVTRLLQEQDPSVAWARLIRSDDTVGIKSNVWRFLPTPPELEEAIRQRVIGAGVAKERIAVDDRGVRDHPVFAKATALINVRPLRTHHWSGVGSCLKNYIMFSPAPWSWHGEACADLAGLWELPAVKGKTRLNILVMLTPLFHGKGPHHFQAEYTWAYKGLIIGTDPVAVDATGVRILEAKRKAFFGKDQPFATSPKHVRVAEGKYGLGVADPKRIDLIRLGWTEGALI